jgi:hypothetical protein
MEDDLEYGDENEVEEQGPVLMRPRLRPQLWQSYQLWHELVLVRQRHTLRISAAEREVSNLDAQFEKDALEHLGIDAQIEYAKKLMVGYGKQVPCWEWITSIRGLKEGSLAAQLLAQIDDIALFDTVSKLWRFCGYAVIDGKAEKNAEGDKGHFSRKLKSICFLVAEQFIRQQTPGYVDIYYAEKARQRGLHPETLCKTCGVPWAECKSKKLHKREFNDGHVHNRAWRKMVKIFLQHLWVQWRTAEGLPVSAPYVEAILGHVNIMESQPAIS